MESKIYAVFDTNVIVSALINESGTCGRAFSLIEDKKVTPVICEQTMAEYIRVLHREKFNFLEEDIYNHILTIRAFGEPEDLFKGRIEEKMIDPDDIIFYRLTLESRKEKNTSLITGNKKHFPIKEYIVNPQEFLRKLNTIG